MSRLFSKPKVVPRKSSPIILRLKSVTRAVDKARHDKVEALSAQYPSFDKASSLAGSVARAIVHLCKSKK